MNTAQINFENNNQFISEAIKNFTNSIHRTNATAIATTPPPHNNDMQKTKRSLMARSNDLSSSASSTSSNSSLEHSIDYEQNNNNQLFMKKSNKSKPNAFDQHQPQFQQYQQLLKPTNDHPLNLSNTSLKKRKSKYDV